jgi:hypothetical protein
MQPLQLRVFGLGLFQNGDVGIGILPKVEQVLANRERSDAGGVGIRAFE